MKKYLCMVLFCLLTFVVVACSNNAQTSQMVDEQFYLVGELLEIKDKSVLMKDEEVGLVWVSLEEALDPEISLKSIIKVRYDGMVAESYPAQTSGVFSEVLALFMKDALIEAAALESGVDSGVKVWNVTKDAMAYVVEKPYRFDVYVRSLYEAEAHKVAEVYTDLPDLNWFYDRLQVQVGQEFYEVGPDFKGQDLLVVGHLDLDRNMGLYEEGDVRIEYIVHEDPEVSGHLYRIVDRFKAYDQVDIKASLLHLDDYISVKYEGVANNMKILDFVTVHTSEKTPLTLGQLATLEGFDGDFYALTGYEVKSLEGVDVYVTENNIGFSFVPTDDMAKRVFFEMSRDDYDLESLYD